MYHVTPFTIVTFAVRLQHKQGLSVLWKGAASVLITKGMLAATEALVSEISSYPRYFFSILFNIFITPFIFLGISLQEEGLLRACYVIWF